MIGTKLTLKELKNGTVEKVFITKNCPEMVINDINYYSSIDNFEIVHLKRTNEELGVLCKKSYMISVLCLKKNE